MMKKENEKFENRERASLRALVNIGPVFEKKLNQIGIFSKEDFLGCDPYEVFEDLRQNVDPTLCRCALASVVDPFSASVREWIAAIPAGRVASYGQIAHLAGKSWGARQVSWILHSQSVKYRLPWQRVIGANGRISLPLGNGFFEQRRLLRQEGVKVDDCGCVDLKKYLWLVEGNFRPDKNRY